MQINEDTEKALKKQLIWEKKHISVSEKAAKSRLSLSIIPTTHRPRSAALQRNVNLQTRK